MKFYKRKTDIDNITTGDFDSFNASQLVEELRAVLGDGIDEKPQKWNLATEEVVIIVNIFDDTLDTSGVAQVIADHVPQDDSDEKAIQAEMIRLQQESFRTQAIANLQSQGKLKRTI